MKILHHGPLHQMTTVLLTVLLLFLTLHISVLAQATRPGKNAQPEPASYNGLRKR